MAHHEINRAVQLTMGKDHAPCSSFHCTSKIGWISPLLRRLYIHLCGFLDCLQEAVKETAILINDEPMGTWTLHTDGASNIRGTGLGVVLKSPQGDNIAQAVRCEWDATNNEAEYEALIFGLHLATDIGVRDISVTCDSLLIVNQIQGSFAAKDDRMIAYLEVAKDLVTKFDKFRDRKSTRLNSSHRSLSRMPSSA